MKQSDAPHLQQNSGVCYKALTEWRHPRSLLMVVMSSLALNTSCQEASFAGDEKPAAPPPTPGAFEIVSPEKETKSSTVTLEWTKSKFANAYQGVISKTEDCKSTTLDFETGDETSHEVKLDDGNYYMCLLASNKGSTNTVATNSPYSFSVDTTPGGFSIDDLPSIINTRSFEVSWSESTLADSYRVYLSSSDGCDNHEEKTTDQLTTKLSALEDGTYYVCAEAVGENDHSVTATNSPMMITIDTLPPVAVLSGGPTSATTNNNAWEITVGGLDVYAYQVKILQSDSCNSNEGYSSPLPISSTISLSGFDDGPIIVCVKGRDEAGNSQAEPTVLSWIQDMSGPSTEISLLGLLHLPAAQASGISLEATYSDETNTAKASFEHDNGCLAEDKNSFTATCPTWHALELADEFSIPGTSLLEGHLSVTVVSSDAVGNETEVTDILATLDGSPPQLTALILEDGAATTQTNAIGIDLEIQDEFGLVDSICLKFNSSEAPELTDSCWIPFESQLLPLSPASTVAINDYPIVIGFIAGTYTVYGWAKDSFDHVSSLGASNVGVSGVDKDDILYDPGQVPALANILATDTAVPNDPPTQAQKTISGGDNLFIKWYATDDEPLPTHPIAISYTTDDETYTSIDDQLLNASNGGCELDNPGTTADDLATGCYEWTSPPTTYFKIRIAVTDADGIITLQTSAPLNFEKINFVAGNTEPGIDGSARSAIFFNDLDSPTMADPGTIVVTRRGEFFFRDPEIGILKVSPLDGLVSLFIPETGTSSGDGGSPTAATLKDVSKIALDTSDNLYIFDYDRIRRVNLGDANPQISTVIGGGVSTDPTTTGLQLQITPIDGQTGKSRGQLFSIARDGKLYFQSATQVPLNPPASGIEVRSYDPETNVVESFTISGTVTSGTIDITDCYTYNIGLQFDNAGTFVGGFNLASHLNVYAGCTDEVGSHIRTLNTTGDVTDDELASLSFYDSLVAGLDSQLYAIRRDVGSILRYEGSTWNTVVGTGTQGQCDDGTAATSCAIDPQDVFVTHDGRVLFLDRGRLRTIDSQGDVRTVFGQGYRYGDGFSPLTARFGEINNLRIQNDGTVIVLDAQERLFRQFNPQTASNVSTVAGNGSLGSPISGSPATDQGLYLIAGGNTFDDFEIDPANGDIFLGHKISGGQSFAISKMSQSSGEWSLVVGGEGKPYYYTIGGATAASEIQLRSYPPRMLGFDNDNFVFVTNRFFSSESTNRHRYSYVMNYDQSSGDVTKVVGHDGDVNGSSVVAATADAICTDGTKVHDCSMPYALPTNWTRMTYDSANSRWIMMITGQVIDSNDQKKVFAAETTGGTPQVVELSTLDRTVNSFVYVAPNKIYYCALDGKLYEHTIGGGADTVLPGQRDNVACAGRTLLHNTGTLTFPYQQNRLYGIAEYTLP